MGDMQSTLIALALGYLLGSIPFGLFFAFASGAGDVRKIGSGNIGATNVLRTGKKWAAAATLLCDGLKGVMAVVVSRLYLPPGFEVIAAAGAVLGHVFPLWLKFKGGKGVATFLGVLIALAWKLAAIFAIVWLIVAATTRISSLSALIATIAVPVAACVLDYNQIAVVSALMAAIILIKHRGNIRRLLAGEEPKIGAKA